MTEPLVIKADVRTRLERNELVKCIPSQYGEVRVWLFALLHDLMEDGLWEAAIWTVFEVKRLDIEMDH